MSRNALSFSIFISFFSLPPLLILQPLIGLFSVLHFFFGRESICRNFPSELFCASCILEKFDAKFNNTIKVDERMYRSKKQPNNRGNNTEYSYVSVVGNKMSQLFYSTHKHTLSLFHIFLIVVSLQLLCIVFLVLLLLLHSVHEYRLFSLLLAIWFIVLCIRKGQRCKTH